MDEELLADHEPGPEQRRKRRAMDAPSARPAKRRQLDVAAAAAAVTVSSVASPALLSTDLQSGTALGSADLMAESSAARDAQLRDLQRHVSQLQVWQE